MIRGFVTGLVWGTVVAGAGLAVLSQTTPLPQAPAEAALAPAPKVEPVAEAAPAEPAPAATAPAETAQDPAPAVEPPKAAEPAPAEPETLSDTPPAAADATAPAPLAPPAPPTAEGRAEMTAPEGEAGDLPRVAPLPTVPPLVAETAPDAAEPPPELRTDSLLEQVPEAAPAPAPQPAPEAMASLPEAPADAPRVIVPDGKPLTETAPKADALPRIGDAPAPVAEAAPEVATPLELFARPFENPDEKPLFAILLIDDGAADTDRETLAALPFPITFVIDPLAPGADAAAAIYRKGGQEVVMQTNGVPKGATAADLEQSYQAFDLALPEAVAVLGVAGLGDNSPSLAAAAVPIIAAQGRGLVTMERGLNAADQMARREGLPQATVFRILDASGESVPVIRRYLDRAAFRAAQEGSVVVLGSTRPDTVAALLQWTVEGRAASVAMAPISAILRQGK